MKGDTKGRERPKEIPLTVSTPPLSLSPKARQIRKGAEKAAAAIRKIHDTPDVGS